MNRLRSKIMVVSLLAFSASMASAEETAIDALMAELESKAEHCESLGDTECARICRSSVQGIQDRFVRRGLDYDSRTKPLIDQNYVRVCDMRVESAEAAERIPDVEGTFQGSTRAMFSVEVEGRDSDWGQICNGSARIRETSGLARMPTGTRVRLVDITYDPDRVGEPMTPCTANRVVLLD